MRNQRQIRGLLAAVLAAGMLAGFGCSAADTSKEAATAAATAALEAAGTAKSTESAADDELIVFAAASMTETLQQCADLYKEEHPDLDIVFNFDSSGTLKTQIQEGADCDLFLSAAQKQMNQMDVTNTEENTEGLDLIDPDTRVNLLENKVALTVPDDNPKAIQNFDNLAERLKAGDILFAMGNSDVPVGQYTEKILAYYGLDENALADAGVITYGSNVKEVTTQVKEGLVDAGVVYCTDATSAGLSILDEATTEMCGQVIYPAAVTRNALHPETAEGFLSFLQTDPCMKIFESVGFSQVSE